MMTPKKSSNRQTPAILRRRRRCFTANGVAYIVLVALTCSAGGDASALPLFSRQTSSIVRRQEEILTCRANLTRRNDECRVNFPMWRGGASSVKASDPKIADILGLTGVIVYLREVIAASVSAWWKEAETTKFLLAGAVAGIVSRTAVSPLEVVATAQMVRGGDKTMVAELSELFNSEGIKGFFKGNAANCLKVAPTRGMQFFAFEKIKRKFVDLKRQSMGLPKGADVELTPLERLVAGGFAGMLASSIVYPIEVVKTMLTMYPGKYAGINAAFRGVINEVGFKGLYAGLVPTLIAMFPYVGVEFMIYETSKIALEKFLKDKNAGDHISLPIVVSLGLGAMAGAAAQTSAHPLDVVRKRLQVQGINGNPILYNNFAACFAGVASKEGFEALYKGLGPACVATIPGTGVAYITYEFMKKLLSLNSV